MKVGGLIAAVVVLGVVAAAVSIICYVKYRNMKRNADLNLNNAENIRTLKEHSLELERIKLSNSESIRKLQDGHSSELARIKLNNAENIKNLQEKSSELLKAQKNVYDLKLDNSAKDEEIQRLKQHIDRIESGQYNPAPQGFPDHNSKFDHTKVVTKVVKIRGNNDEKMGLKHEDIDIEHYNENYFDDNNGAQGSGYKNDPYGPQVE